MRKCVVVLLSLSVGVACGDAVHPLDPAPVERYVLASVGGVTVPAPIVPASVGGQWTRGSVVLDLKDSTFVDSLTGTIDGQPPTTWVVKGTWRPQGDGVVTFSVTETTLGESAYTMVRNDAELRRGFLRQHFGTLVPLDLVYQRQH